MHMEILGHVHKVYTLFRRHVCAPQTLAYEDLEAMQPCLLMGGTCLEVNVCTQS